MTKTEQYDAEDAEILRHYQEMADAIRGEIDCTTCIAILNYLRAGSNPRYAYNEILTTARIYQAAHLAKTHRQATFLP